MQCCNKRQHIHGATSCTRQLRMRKPVHRAGQVFYLNATWIEPLWVLFASWGSEDPKRTFRGKVLEFRGPSEVIPRSHIGRIEVLPRRQRGQIEKKCQTSPVFDYSSPVFEEPVPKTAVFSRKNYQTSHHFPKPVPTFRGARHKF
jgi:hypothetical protein